MKFTVIRATKTAGFLLFAIFANPLMAGTETDYSLGWYMGGNVGISDAKIDKNRITQSLTNYSYSNDDLDRGYKLFGGYQFNTYFSLEGGYFDLGKFNYALATSGGSANGNIKVKGVNLDAVATLPMTEDFSAFGRVGANYAQSKDSFSSTGYMSFPDPNPKKTDLNYKYGAGLQYAITDAVGFRLEAERYRINDAVGNLGDIDLFSVGLTYRFGVTKEVAPVVKEEEEEVVVLVTAPEAPEKIKETTTQKKTITLVFQDIHFEFDKATLNKEAKDALKSNIAQLGENPNITMLVAGYTSEIGTEKYNQGLSERRAESVKDYIIQEKLFPAEKISTIGYGQTRPALYEAKPKNIHSKAAQANMRVLLKIVHE